MASAQPRSRNAQASACIHRYLDRVLADLGAAVLAVRQADILRCKLSFM